MMDMVTRCTISVILFAMGRRMVIQAAESETRESEYEKKPTAVLLSSIRELMVALTNTGTLINPENTEK